MSSAQIDKAQVLIRFVTAWLFSQAAVGLYQRLPKLASLSQIISEHIAAAKPPKLDLLGAERHDGGETAVDQSLIGSSIGLDGAPCRLLVGGFSGRLNDRLMAL